MASNLFYFLTYGTAPGDGRIYRGALRADGFPRVLDVPAGLDWDRLCLLRPVGPIELVGSDPATLAFTGDETLSGSIWAGNDGPELAGIAGGWEDHETGVCRFSQAGSIVDALEQGRTYNLRLILSATDGDGPRTWPIHDGLIRILPSPGAGTDPTGPAYCTARDIDAEAPWTADERAQFGPTAGWVDEIDKASRWVDSCILIRASTYRSRWYWQWDYERDYCPTPLEWEDDIRAALADGRMQPDGRLKRATALYALHLIRSYAMDAAVRQQYRRDAIRELSGFWPRLDLDDDGTFETWIRP